MLTGLVSFKPVKRSHVMLTDPLFPRHVTQSSPCVSEGGGTGGGETASPAGGAGPGEEALLHPPGGGRQGAGARGP